MSFINLLVREDFISIVSDGQISLGSEITDAYFKKFQVSPKGFVIGLTGYEKILTEVKKKFYYQPGLDYDEARDYLLDLLLHYKDKQVGIGKVIRYNAVIAGFVNGVAQASSFHAENGAVSQQDYVKDALISLAPDDIDFNPNQWIKSGMHEVAGELPQAQLISLQRAALLKVAEQSATVNRVIFQHSIEKNLLS